LADAVKNWKGRENEIIYLRDRLAAADEMFTRTYAAIQAQLMALTRPAVSPGIGVVPDYPDMVGRRYNGGTFSPGRPLVSDEPVSEASPGEPRPGEARIGRAPIPYEPTDLPDLDRI
jgi:hypothetical protein